MDRVSKKTEPQTRCSADDPAQPQETVDARTAGQTGELPDNLDALREIGQAVSLYGQRPLGPPHQIFPVDSTDRRRNTLSSFCPQPEIPEQLVRVRGRLGS